MADLFFRFPYHDRIEINKPLAALTTFQIGGAAQYFFCAKTSDEFVAALDFTRNNKIPFFLLGGGSNVVISDSGFEGLVIQNKSREVSYEPENFLTASSGVSWGVLTAKAHEHGLVGVEELTHIPGTIGGAVRGNAGSMGKETKDVLESVAVWREGEVCTMRADECGFAYRESIFKKHSEWAVISARFVLKKGDVASARDRMREYGEKRRASQPLNMPCPGCMFKNPAPETGLFASKMIDELGLKGFQIGGVRVSPKHANFFENVGGGSSKDVLDLVAYVKEKVFAKYGVELKEEVVLV